MRADYAPSQVPGLASGQKPPGVSGGHIATVAASSPAARAGLRPGMRILAVDGKPLRDVIDWLWETDSAQIQVSLDDGSKPALARNFGEGWGIDFVDPLFDELITCCNGCIFCFMTMLPTGMRPSLYVRDDDYRLSFLQGNFVTLTNLDDTEVERVIECALSPLHVSLHAITPTVRRQLIGKNEARGIEVLEQLLASGIEVHVQLVLVPGINDGSELAATLDWIEARPGILSAGIVPYGYTRFARIQGSYDAQVARTIIAQVAPYQERSRTGMRADGTEGVTRFQLADEWFLLAEAPLPPAEEYDGFPQFEDGIGMLRSFIDDFEQTNRAEGYGVVSSLQSSDEPPSGFLPRLCDEPPPNLSARPVLLVTGEAFAPTLRQLVQSLAQRPVTPIEVVAIRNDFFGGNVTVAGLLTAQDILRQLIERNLPSDAAILIPEVLFNADGLTLDDSTVEDMTQALNREVVVVPCTAEGLLEAICGVMAARVHDKTHGGDL